MADILAAECIRCYREVRVVVGHAYAIAHGGCLSLLQVMNGSPMVQKVRRAERRKQTTILCILSLLVALSTFLFTTFAGSFTGGNCPAQSSARPQQQIAGGPISLLAIAQQVTPPMRKSQILKQCAHWKVADGRKLPLTELHAQLQCHNLLLGTLTESSDVTTEALALVERTSSILGVVRDTNQQCEALQTKLRSLQQSGVAARKPAEAIVALGGLSGFERPARDAFSALKLVTETLEQRMGAGDWDAEDALHEVPSVRMRFRSCMLDVVREARSIARRLPANSPATQRAQECRPDLLRGLERLALSEAELDADAGIIFSSGLLMSEISTAIADVPFFGSAQADFLDPAEDSKGARVVKGVIVAEEQLGRALQVSFGPELDERSIRHAIRLCQHAKFLMEKQLYAAAEWRYRDGAALAAKHGRDKLASHALAELSYMMSLQGDEVTALEVADEAMRLSPGQPDQLASYQQVALRLSLGELRTDDQARSAAEQLAAIEGKLPGEHLEDQRASMLKNLAAWRDMSVSTSLTSCLGMDDAAYILICLMGRLAYA